MARKRRECLLRPLRSCQDIFHRKLTGRFQILQFVPIDRQGNWRARTRSNRIVGDRVAAGIIPEIIDEDPARAFGFAHRRDISLGRCGHHFIRYRCGEVFHLFDHESFAANGTVT